MFDNKSYIDVESKVLYRISVLSYFRKNIEKKGFKQYRRQGLEISHISEMNITFLTSLDSMKYKHYIEQPMPMVEGLVNRKLCRNYELIKTIDAIDLILHMGAYENREEDVYYNSDEDE